VPTLFATYATLASLVGAARNGDTHLLAGLEHAIAGDGVGDAIKQGEYRLYRSA